LHTLKEEVISHQNNQHKINHLHQKQQLTVSIVLFLCTYITVHISPSKVGLNSKNTIKYLIKYTFFIFNGHWPYFH